MDASTSQRGLKATALADADFHFPGGKKSQEKRHVQGATRCDTHCHKLHIWLVAWATSEVKMSLPASVCHHRSMPLCQRLSVLSACLPTTRRRSTTSLHGGAVHDEVHQTVRLGLPSSSATPATFFLLFHGWRSRKMSWRARRRRPRQLLVLPVCSLTGKGSSKGSALGKLPSGTRLLCCSGKRAKIVVQNMCGELNTRGNCVCFESHGF